MSQSRMNSIPMDCVYAGATIFRMCQRDQIVNDEGRLDSVLAHRLIVAPVFHSGVTCMQQDAATRGLVAHLTDHGPGHEFGYSDAVACLRGKQVERTL